MRGNGCSRRLQALQGERPQRRLHCIMAGGVIRLTEIIAEQRQLQIVRRQKQRRLIALQSPRQTGFPRPRQPYHQMQQRHPSRRFHPSPAAESPL